MLLLVGLASVASGCFDKPGFHGGDAAGAIDAPSDMAEPPNVMFVTSMPVELDTGPGGLDTTCTGIANSAGHPGTFVAWVSTATIDAKSRLGSATGWVRPDGTPFANTVEDLTSGHIYEPPSLDELDKPVDPDVPVATGTHADGTDDSGHDCSNFTGGNNQIAVGFTDGASPIWTDAMIAPSCSETLFPIYCFEVDHRAYVPAPTTYGPLVFVSSDPFLPGTMTGFDTGATVADDICNSEALAHHYPGAYSAVLALVAEQPLARIGGASQHAWVRVDGVPVTRDFTTFDAPISVDANGRYVDDQVYTGAQQANGLPDSYMFNCDDWTETSGTPYVGFTTRGLETFSGTTVVDCQTAMPVYCAQAPF